MDAYQAGGELAELLDRARAQVGAMQAPTPPSMLEDPHAIGVGTAGDGLVRAQMDADGRLVGLLLDERSTSLPRHELQQEIIEAVNAAWASAPGADPAEAAVSAADRRLLLSAAWPGRPHVRLPAGLEGCPRHGDHRRPPRRGPAAHRGSYVELLYEGPLDGTGTWRDLGWTEDPFGEFDAHDEWRPA
ncbi:YbaB/EbfC family nucleoid-associated protein [Micromonospora trifolii]|uniref:YbaB/EbfC family nucleoid-associated protein n=1 Tax=Micromonospora trifolii TaxID=2911208 RepID=UPI003D2F1FA6